MHLLTHVAGGGPLHQQGHTGAFPAFPFVFPILLCVACLEAADELSGAPLSCARPLLQCFCSTEV